MTVMKKFDIKTTEKEVLAKWYHLMTLGRALDEKGSGLFASIIRVVVPFTLCRTRWYTVGNGTGFCERKRLLLPLL